MEGFSFGAVDVTSVDNRSDLVAALRAKLGVADVGLGGGLPHAMPDFGAGLGMPQETMTMPELLPMPGASSGAGDSLMPGLGGVMAELDRGLDQRQKLIDALKVQLSKSSALPKSAPTRRVEHLPPASDMFSGGSVASLGSSAPAPSAAATAMGGFGLFGAGSVASAPGGGGTNMAPLHGFGAPAPLQQPTSTHLVDSSPDWPPLDSSSEWPRPPPMSADMMEPAAKRFRLDTTPSSPDNDGGMEDPMKFLQAASDAAALAAQKAKMLRNLEAATPTPPPPALMAPTPPPATMAPTPPPAMAPTPPPPLVEAARAPETPAAVPTEQPLLSATQVMEWDSGRGEMVAVDIDPELLELLGGPKAPEQPQQQQQPLQQSKGKGGPQPMSRLGAGVKGPPGAGGPGPKGGPPQPAAPPPGASPEEYEAYRLKCWAEYNDYCNLWEKYSKKRQQQDGAGGGDGMSKGSGKGMAKAGGPPSAEQVMGSMSGQLGSQQAAAVASLVKCGGKPFGGGMQMAGGQFGKGGNPLHFQMAARPPPHMLRPQQAMPGKGGLGPRVISPQAHLMMEDDIHSKLMGL